ncbi:hypothetical protein Taro_020970, partial [Colocasia esculenta]|nr:hypothetical protein [Colocasia esculenta]
MRTSGSLAGGWEVGSLQLVSERGSTEICKEVCGFRARFVCVLQVGCSCCCVACMASVVARCVHAVVARLVVDSLAVVFPCGGWLQASPGAVLLVVFGALVVCVPLWLREPACGVAFTGAGLLSVEPAEVRFPQNCAVLVSGCYCVALWVKVHRLVARCSGK